MIGASQSAALDPPQCLPLLRTVIRETKVATRTLPLGDLDR